MHSLEVTVRRASMVELFVARISNVWIYVRQPRRISRAACETRLWPLLVSPSSLSQRAVRSLAPAQRLRLDARAMKYFDLNSLRMLRINAILDDVDPQPTSVASSYYLDACLRSPSINVDAGLRTVVPLVQGTSD